MSISDLQEPPPEFDGQVDIEDFWHSVSEEILCRGFVKSRKRANLTEQAEVDITEDRLTNEIMNLKDVYGRQQRAFGPNNDSPAYAKLPSCMSAMLSHKKTLRLDMLLDDGNKGLLVSSLYKAKNGTSACSFDLKYTKHP
ncbi:hypothetical protein NQZ68_030070 [Dissostichus eleginoides]|nr:hypothetical protein NQZ68_030070 [Dissostichus eleginoides]